MRPVLHSICSALLLAALCRAGDTDASNLNSLTLEQLMHVKVEGAALHSQTLEDAPASVSVITAEDIRKYGYRTLGEALSSQRGFFLGNNRSYETMGVRGFNLPGDYASHIMVMVNGHNMADNVFDYMLFFGNDFPIDMNLIQQIEIIRGPASALYGSNAIFATINIITKTPEHAGPSTLTLDSGSFGEKKAQVQGTQSVGSGSVLLSGSIFNNTGESPIYFPEFDSPETNYGKAIRMNGEKGYHLFGSLAWRNWTVTSAFSGRDRTQPVSWGAAIFNDRGTQVNDDRGFIEALYSRQMASGTLHWRTYYDSYHFLGREDFMGGDGSVEDNRSDQLGNWLGTQLSYRLPLPVGDVTLSAETKIDLRNLQRDYDVSPERVVYLNSSNPDRSFALIVQDEKQLSRGWKVDAGLRFDFSSYRSSFVSPRAAAIYQRSAWTYKFLYGRSFRNPSPFQLYYDDGLSGVANPQARSESADTVEVDVEHRFGKKTSVQASAYAYRLDHFLLGMYTAAGLIQYLNTGTIRAGGAEIEVNIRPSAWLEIDGSYSAQRSDDGDADHVLENSPHHLGKLRLSTPLGRRFDFSSAMQYQSSVRSLGGATVKPFYLADFTLVSKHLLPEFDVRVGIRNAFNRTYWDAIALNPLVDTMQQPGRSFFVELIAHRPR